MPYKPSNAHTLICTLTLHLETDTGARPNQHQMTQASDTLVATIRQRLFGEGFLPAGICIDQYGITID